MLGYDHDAFWDQTPRTLSLTFEAYNNQLKDEHNERAWLAWHIAALQRSKKFPHLRSLLVKESETQPSWQQQLEGLKQWVQATGGKIVYRQ
jgi:predicted alpha-1,6-mannanase (GH76 family)